MAKSFILGLTGPTGSGKSTVSQLLKEAGCAVVDADQAARLAVAPGGPALRALQAEFGPDIIDEKGNLRRRVLAQLAFSSPEKTERLNQITHPFIVQLMQKEMEDCESRGAEIIVLDAPLLFEAGMEKICRAVAVVTAPKEQRLQRIMKRDSLSLEAAKTRMGAQKEEEYYTAKANYVLTNGEDKEHLGSQVKQLLQQLREEYHV